MFRYSNMFAVEKYCVVTAIQIDSCTMFFMKFCYNNFGEYWTNLVINNNN